MIQITDPMKELEDLGDIARQSCVVIAGWGKNYLYYFEVDHFPEPDEYLLIGTRLADTMLKTIGQYPQRWYLIAADAFDLEAVRHVLERDPIRVS